MQSANNTEQDLALAKQKFDQEVEAIALDRQKQLAKLSGILNTYLHQWCDYHENVSELLPKRLADETAVAKYDLADHVRHQLKRLNFAIDYKDQPTMLYSLRNKKCLPGYFLLMAKDSRKSLINRSNLSELLTAATVLKNTQPGFKLVEGTIRHEGLTAWRERTKPIVSPRERTS